MHEPVRVVWTVAGCTPGKLVGLLDLALAEGTGTEPGIIDTQLDVEEASELAYRIRVVVGR